LCVILFYKPGCPFCKPLKEVWEALAKSLVFINVMAFNATESEMNKTFIHRIREDSPGIVTTFPSIVFYNNGVPVEVYASTDRSLERLTDECMRVKNNQTFSKEE
jgi:thiol-disulfide isomerase/thioredoxin